MNTDIKKEDIKLILYKGYTFGDYGIVSQTNRYNTVKCNENNIVQY